MATIFPTPVGVNRKCLVCDHDISDFPHTRGGEPVLCRLNPPVFGFSPHPWG